MSERKLEELDIGALFHTLLFAYQKAVRDIMGPPGAAIFVHPVLDTIRKIHEEKGVDLLKGETMDEVFENFSRMLEGSGSVGEVRFEKIGPQKYILHIDECVFAPHVHHMLKPRDVTCPYALIAMSLFEKMLGGKVKLADSEFTENGNKTKIELLE